MKFLEFYIMYKEADSITGALFVVLAELVYSAVMLALKTAIFLVVVRLVWSKLPYDISSFYVEMIHLAFTR